MAASIADIIDYLDELLNAAAFSDYGPNGLQVPGRDRVETVATGVSAHAPLIERAAADGADLLLVHHGLFWRGQPLEITPLMHRRLKPLYAAELALAAYHLPLDGHPAHGNNALLANALRAVDPEPFGEHDGAHIGMSAQFQGEGVSIPELTDRVAAATGGRPPLVIAPDPNHSIKSIGIVSGGGTSYINEAIELGLDSFMTGEPSEKAFGIAHDSGITYIAAGHHATETLGVKRLGELLARDFDVAHIHIDIDNPI
jgi:dinuclear metal center YbgI/SA1388 family protein